jgi:hypothetical protein
MKNLLISLMVVCLSVGAYAQTGAARYSNFVPSDLSAGTRMTGITMDTSLDDTTATFSTIGYSYIGAQFTASADSVGILVAWRGSRDGSTWSAFATYDSVISRTTTVTAVGGISLPDKALAFPFIQLRFTDSADSGFGANPAPTVRVEVIRRY